MSQTRSDTPAPLVTVEVTRGELVESRHRVAVAVSDKAGGLRFAAGDPSTLIYPRSAAKPLQALALVESGALAAYGRDAAELALACASHQGEARHVDLVGAWLAAIGCDEADLACGAHQPGNPAAARALAAAGAQPTPIHNNCSGKHAGFLTLARHEGWPTAGYLEPDHPVQRRVRKLLEELSGSDLAAAPQGIDGCGIPVYGMTLADFARAMARLGDPVDLAPGRRDACRQVFAAMIAEPLLVDGSGGETSALLAAAGGRAIVKTGAEGVFSGALAEGGLGFAVKAEDGAKRAAALVTAHLLDRLGALEGLAGEARRRLLKPRLHNWAGTEIGEIRLAAEALAGF